MTGSRHMRVGGGRGAWTALRARSRASSGEGLLPDRETAPPATLLSLAPTFRRRPRQVTTHAAYGGGDPRLILAPREDLWPGDRQPVFRLRRDVVTIGSDERCNVCLPGLQPLHAEVHHDQDDEFWVVDLGGDTRVNGERVDRAAAHGLAGPGGTLDDDVLPRNADYGRPYGGRVGGEVGYQRPQPGRHRVDQDRKGTRSHVNDDAPVLVAGATGFVGRRLTRALEEAGRHVRAMTRHPDDYDGPGEPVHGDVHDASTPPAALAGCSAAYLVHSLGSADFERLDAEAAKAFGEAAAEVGLEQIASAASATTPTSLSAHLRSRREVEALGAAGVPVTVLRAGIVIGAGGISWEMTRHSSSTCPR